MLKRIGVLICWSEPFPRKTKLKNTAYMQYRSKQIHLIPLCFFTRIECYSLYVSVDNITLLTKHRGTSDIIKYVQGSHFNTQLNNVQNICIRNL